jgi:hypothetical protein
LLQGDAGRALTKVHPGHFRDGKTRPSWAPPPAGRPANMMALCNRWLSSYASPMSDDRDNTPRAASDVLLSFPPRPLTQEESNLVAEWLSLAADVSLAYVSTRRSDDPAMYQRVIISDVRDNSPTHLVHAPSSLHLWVKLTVGRDKGVELFDSLSAALNSIRHVLR